MKNPMRHLVVLLVASMLAQQPQSAQQVQVPNPSQQQQQKDEEPKAAERLKELDALDRRSDTKGGRKPPLLESYIAPLMEQDASFDLKSISWEQWLSGKGSESIPWDIQIESPALRMDQRLEVAYSARIKAKSLNKLGNTHDVFFLSAVGAANGKCCLVAPKVVHYSRNEAIPETVELRFTDALLAQPGDYFLWLILYDKTKNLHNVYKRQIHVRPIENDPMPNADKALPEVELPRLTDRERGTILEFFDGLALPVANKTPLQVDIVSIVSPRPHPKAPADIILRRYR